MARKVNKSQAIRDALAANPDKSPSDIAEMLQAKGLKVNAQYVSTIKSTSKAKGKRKSVRRAKPGRAAANGMASISAAVKFINEAGGIEQARQAFQTVERIHSGLR